MPAPVMTPQEVLALFLHGFCDQRGRTPSEHEHRWYQETLDGFAKAANT